MLPPPPRQDTLVDADAHIFERFALEALARVRHPHVAQIYDAGEADGQPSLAREPDPRPGGQP